MDKIQKTEMEEDDWELIKVLEEAEGWNFEIFNIFSNFFSEKKEKKRKQMQLQIQMEIEQNEKERQIQKEGI